jgi:hypothetical protein
MLKSNAVLAALLFCLILMVCVAVMTEDVHAQSSDKKADGATSADKKLATQEGLGDKEIDENQLPGKFEIGLALGSIVALIGVMKYV